MHSPFMNWLHIQLEPNFGYTESPVFSRFWRAQRGDDFATLDWVARFLSYQARAQRGETLAVATLRAQRDSIYFATLHWVTRCL